VTESSNLKMKMGLGEAISRLLHVEKLFQSGAHISDSVLKERSLLVEALNHLELDLGFDCNQDGIPDTVEIFEKSATTSCCRILPSDNSRRQKSSSRR
jgi:hypothetical protein